MTLSLRHLAPTLFIAAIVSSCRDVDYALPATDSTVTDPEHDGSQLSGFYLLCEGNMGSNKASLDFFDFATGVYTRNIYSDRNPTVVKELGDVGNDIQVYGSRLYVVVNCSNKVEVLSAASGVRIGQVDIPNCRYVRFAGGKAYVSSYVGGVGSSDSGAVCGAVYEVDTASLAIERACSVGYQPEEMEITPDGRMYVCNSGGYMAPDYDDEISVIDLTSMTEERRIRVAKNLHRIRRDAHGNIWVSTRGDYGDEKSRLFVLESVDGQMEVVDSMDVRVSNMAMRGDSLYVIASEWDDRTQQNSISYAIVNVLTHKVVSRNFISDGTESDIETPYGIALHPTEGDIYVTDAKNYVSSGKLFCFSKDGVLKWTAQTGDIPSAIAFVGPTSQSASGSGSNPDKGQSPYTSVCYEYCPAPGQFVNLMPKYEEGDNAETMALKAGEALSQGSTITLGAYGGYVTFGFDHRVVNRPDTPDFRIDGNALYNTATYAFSHMGGSAEPGIVMVSLDANGNGLPDDQWYELAGSAHAYPDSITHGYEITYSRPAADHTASPHPESTSISDTQYILWTDNHGASGYVEKNTFHTQDYYPQWIDSETLTFRGSLLAPNAVRSGGQYLLMAYEWGYADSHPNAQTSLNSFDIDWATDSDGNPVSLPGADFIRVYTAVSQSCGWLGETSTEVGRAVDLSMEE